MHSRLRSGGWDAPGRRAPRPPLKRDDNDNDNDDDDDEDDDENDDENDDERTRAPPRTARPRSHFQRRSAATRGRETWPLPHPVRGIVLATENAGHPYLSSRKILRLTEFVAIV